MMKTRGKYGGFLVVGFERQPETSWCFFVFLWCVVMYIGCSESIARSYQKIGGVIKNPSRKRAYGEESLVAWN